MIYDLAKIYAQERFRDTLRELTEEEKLRYHELAELLYCHFEDGYVAFCQMPRERFDFSDI